MIAVRSSVRCTAFTRVLSGPSVGSVQAKGPKPTRLRWVFTAARSSVTCTALITIVPGARGSSVNVKEPPLLPCGVPLAVAPVDTFPTASKAQTR